MSVNLSKQKRDNMLTLLENLKTELKDSPETCSMLLEIENELNRKKYGLVWEEHEEFVDEEIKKKIPVFKERADLEIKNSDTPDFNFIIEGDNLHSLYLLEKTHKGLIDLIYIDPPYNTGKKDFIYDDQIVGKDDTFRHSKWLSFMYKRLIVAQKLLKKDGVIFISIEDNEVAQLRLLCDEVFGEDNFIAILSIENNPKGRKNSKFISISNEFCIVYAKDKNKSEFIENIPKSITDVAVDENGNYVHNSGKRVLVGENSFNELVTDFSSDKHYTVYYNKELGEIKIIQEQSVDETNQELLNDGYERYYSYNNGQFVLNTYSKKRIQELFDDGALEFKNGKIYEKNFSTSIRLKSMVVNKEYKAVIDNEEKDFKIDVKTTSAGTEIKNIFGTDETPFSNPKNTGLIKLLITLFENKDITVLDFFAGSGTTAQAVLEQNQLDGGNRKFILCTNNEVNEKTTKEFAVNNGYIPNKRAFNGFKDTEEYKEMCNSDEFQKMGICRAITHTRLKTVITGKRMDGSTYSDGIPANVKYYQTEFINRIDEENEDYFIVDELSTYIKELVQLENWIDISDEKYNIVFDEDELDELIEDSNTLQKCKALYINRDVMMTQEQQEIITAHQIKVVEIPDYYFKNEIMEVEGW